MQRWENYTVWIGKVALEEDEEETECDWMLHKLYPLESLWHATKEKNWVLHRELQEELL